MVFAYDIVFRFWAYSLGLTLALGLFIAMWKTAAFYDRVNRNPEAAGMVARIIAVLLAVLMRQPIMGRHGFITRRRWQGSSAVVTRDNKYFFCMKAAFQVTLVIFIISSLIMKWMGEP
ncbi:MAG: hypothetical protein SFW63_06515 [Alphaproteobacteria bacterium]|nr:hypothetical protein [Alphaproteobacteria bacterium]